MSLESTSSAARSRPPAPAYLRALDGLRGVAALVVVARHSFGALPMTREARMEVLGTPLGIPLNAQGAVELFFVLSGFVLAGSISRNRSSLDLVAYYVKRWFRIHPPYLAGVLFAWCAGFFYVVPEPAELSSWIRKLSAVHIDAGELWRSLWFPGGAYGQLPVGWTLTVEAIFSILMPLFLVIARRTHWAVLLVLAMALPILVGERLLLFGIDFALGVATYLERERLRRWASRAPAWVPWCVLGVALWSWVPGVLGWSTASDLFLEMRRITVMGAGSASLLVLVMTTRWPNRFFSLGPVVGLGRISYSLYLVHIPVLVLAAPLAIGIGPWPAGVTVFGVTAVVSLAISLVGYRLVERPSILLGNRLCRSLGRRLGTEVVVSARATPA